MLLRKEVTHATDLDLLTALIGNRATATKLFAKAHFSLFALLHSMPHENGDLFCAEGPRAYAPDPLMKLLAARELATRAIAEDLQGRSCLTSPCANPCPRSCGKRSAPIACASRVVTGSLLPVTTRLSPQQYWFLAQFSQ